MELSKLKAFNESNFSAGSFFTVHARKLSVFRFGSLDKAKSYKESRSVKEISIYFNFKKFKVGKDSIFPQLLNLRI